MRTIVDLPEEHVKALDSIGDTQNLPRAELVRRAVDLYLSEEKKKRSDEAVDKYYGFLKDVPEAFEGADALEYEREIRGEWDERDKMYSNWAMHDNQDGDFKHKDDEKS